MRSSFTLFRVGGIKVGVHWTWFFILLLLTWTFSAEIYTYDDTGWSDRQRWTAGTGTAIVFFLSVLLHELSHSFVARRLGMEVDSITLFILGGVSNLKGEMRSAKQEFAVAIVGPLTSFALAGLLGLAWFLLRDRSPVFDLGVGYLAVVNLALGIFNLLPGFPLDGGRVLRAVVWSANHDLVKATRVVTRVGIAFSYLLMAAGGVFLLAFGIVGGLWWILIGWFLRNAAEASYTQLVVDRATSGLTAGDVAERNYHIVEPTMTIRALIDDEIFRHFLRVFPVIGGGRLLGLVTLADVKRVPQDQWDQTTVYRAMTPVDRLASVGTRAPIEEVLALLREHDVNQVAVLDGATLVGFVSRAHVVQVIQTRTELGEAERR